ncbi:hypothetical protein [Nocardia cyriacigeorgica]|uniref:hypothetical protein n=1 Tax=Nocardia cyriacigeorgica TaxID=135487 RepID=UPI001895D3AF|nr:hypothetical protein [Nocardia cyriacigeorgica]MBF6326814.1 hypothetical protein [Nocardia cyriacigeorgica]
MTAPDSRAEVAELLDELIVRTTNDAKNAPTGTAKECERVRDLLAIAESAASVAVLLGAITPETAPGAGESVPAPGGRPSNPHS